MRGVGLGSRWFFRECVVRRERQCTFEKVERHLARNIGKEDEKCVRHLRQRLVILLVR